MNICVYGSASNKIDPAYIKAGEELGMEIARRGHSLIFGGGGNGLMGAAARGVASLNGKITGIIPKFFVEETLEALYDGCDELIYTDNMNERKQLLEDMSDAYIVTPGGLGTYDEFFGVLTQKQLNRHEKPIALFNTLNYFDELEELIYRSMTKRFIKANCRMLYMSFTDMDDMFSYLENVRPLGLNARDFKDG